MSCVKTIGMALPLAAGRTPSSGLRSRGPVNGTS
jgi:hypothetical protein